MSEHKPLGPYDWPGFLVLALFLVVRCIYRIAVPAGEWPLPPAHYLSMGIDLVLGVGLFVLGQRLLRVFEDQDARRPLLHLAYWPGLIAAALLLAIRVTDNQSWWTGHLN